MENGTTKDWNESSIKMVNEHSENEIEIVYSDDSGFEKGKTYSKNYLTDFLKSRKDCFITSENEDKVEHIETFVMFSSDAIVGFKFLEKKSLLVKCEEINKEKLMENSKLEMLSGMVTSALAKIIDENSKSDFTVEDVIAKCSTNESVEEFNNSVDFRIQLIDKLLDEFFCDVMEQWKIGNNWTRGFNVTNFKTWFDSLDDISKDQVVEYVGASKINQSMVAGWLGEQSTSVIIKTISEACVDDVIRDYYEDIIIDNYLDNSSASDIIDRCSSSLEDDFREYFADSLEEDFKDRARDAIDNM